MMLDLVVVVESLCCFCNMDDWWCVAFTMVFMRWRVAGWMAVADITTRFQVEGSKV